MNTPRGFKKNPGDMAMIDQRKTGSSDLLFVYGTLRRGCDNEWAQALAAQSHYIGKASLRGRLYRVGSYPAFVPDAAAGPVAGDLFRLHDPGRTLAWLDAYEECTPPFPEPWEYQRVIATVKVDEGARNAWTYIYSRPTGALPIISGGDFLDE